MTAAAAERGGRRDSAPPVPAPRREVAAAAARRPGMAFMEKPPAGKVLLDDTVPLTAAIEASQSLQSHTVRGPPGAGRGGGADGAGRGTPAWWAGRAACPRAQADAEARRHRARRLSAQARGGKRSSAVAGKGTRSWGTPGPSRGHARAVVRRWPSLCGAPGFPLAWGLSAGGGGDCAWSHRCRWDFSATPRSSPAWPPVAPGNPERQVYDLCPLPPLTGAVVGSRALV